MNAMVQKVGISSSVTARASVRQATCSLGFTSTCSFRSSAVPAGLRQPLQSARSTRVTRQAAQNKAKPQYDTSAPRINPGEAAFTRRRELFVGRLAMLGFLSATLGEIATGKGPLGQLRLETLLPQPVINVILLAIVGYSGFSALRPGSYTFSDENQQDVAKRPKGPTQDPTIYPGDGPQKYLGISKTFGFTKKNEIFVGRTAMIGFAAACIGEKLTNKGPLGQLGIPFGLPLNSTYAGFGLGAWVLFLLFAAIGNQKFGPEDDRTDIY